MLSTAAGTIRPAKVVVIGAGVAGLQAIATSKRLGAQVEAYDIRSDAREQVQSLGAKMIELPFSAEGTGGYARSLTEEEKIKQQDILQSHLEKANVIISTAGVPGKKAPVIITESMIKKLLPETVIIDSMADEGGNCELIQPGQIIQSTWCHAIWTKQFAKPYAQVASELLSKNVNHLLKILFKENN